MTTRSGNVAESTDESLIADLSELIATHKVFQRDLCLIVLVVDDLDAIRGLYGSTTAGEVLGGLGRRIDALTRGTDLVTRADNNEYAVVLTTISDPEDAQLVAEKLRRQIGEPMSAGGHEIHVTAHIGIAVAREGDSGTDLLERARRRARSQRA